MIARGGYDSKTRLGVNFVFAFYDTHQRRTSGGEWLYGSAAYHASKGRKARNNRLEQHYNHSSQRFVLILQPVTRMKIPQRIITPHVGHAMTHENARCFWPPCHWFDLEHLCLLMFLLAHVSIK